MLNWKYALPGIVDADAFNGQFLLHPGDVEIIFKLASRHQTYVEIGVAHGSSAVVAGKAGCEVWGIDPLDGTRIPGAVETVAFPPNEANTLTNWVAQGLPPEMFHLYVQRHPPWPEEIANKRFDIGFIDGWHSYEQMKIDAYGMLQHVDHVIIFHDVMGACHTKDLLVAFDELLIETADEWEDLDISALTNRYSVIRGLVRIIPEGEKGK